MDAPSSQKGHLLPPIDEWAQQFETLSEQLNAVRTVHEPTFASRLPLLGPLIVAFRQLWSYVAAKWYARSIIEQQNRFNVQLVQSLDTLASMMMELRSHLEPEKLVGHGPEFAWVGIYGFIGTPAEQMLTRLDEEALREWENAGLPELEPYTYQREVHRGEELEEEIAINYPLHWRSWNESWRYLFDLALVGEALACRPGDLVLDYAAGPCWIAEFLNRLSIQTVSLDISPDMLQRGRQRMRSDRRLAQSVDPLFTLGDTSHLPFADNSFDGVICMNSLHHMPSYRQALAEIYRVLKPSGRAVFSEPGAKHAYHPYTQHSMKESAILEKNVPLPLIYVLAQQVGFHKMQVIPLSQPTYYPVDYTASSADNKTLAALWERTLRISSCDWSRFVLEKPPAPMPNTYDTPSTIFRHEVRAEITPRHTCAQAPAGCSFTDRIAVRNTGNLLWRSQHSRFGGEVYLAVSAYTTDGQLVQQHLAGATLPHDLAPEEEVEMAVLVEAVLEPGRYILQYDMVIEHIVWFSHLGSPVFRRPIEVLPVGAEITLVQTCAQAPANSELVDRIVVRNTSPFTWPAQGPLFGGGGIGVGVKVYQDGEFVRDDLGRTPLPHDIAPGETAEVEVSIPVSLNPGAYLLRYDMVIEQVGWFEHGGAPTVERPLTVTP